MNVELIEMSVPFAVNSNGSPCVQVRSTDGEGVVRLVIFVGPGAKEDAQGYSNSIKGVTKPQIEAPAPEPVLVRAVAPVK